MSATWHCLDPDCDEHGEGMWAPVDKSAERHTKTTKHPTTTEAIGSRRVRDEAGTRDVKP